MTERFWTGRAVMVAVTHFMVFGAFAAFATIELGGGDSMMQAPQQIYGVLSLPLITTLREENAGAILAYFPDGISGLLALTLFAANSMIWGLAIDGYLRIFSRFRHR
jgi:hypothetical protein